MIAATPKVAKLIRLLASPEDHEVLAAARALRKTLKASGSSLNELADEIEHKAPAPDDDWRREDVKLRAEFCIAADDGRLTPIERGKLSYMLRHRATEKERAWLHRIEMKLTMGGRR